MWPVLASLGLAMLLTHLALTHPPVRGALVARMGEKGFAGLFSMIALALWGPLVVLWWTHRHEGPLWWALRSPVVTHGTEAVAALAFALIVGAMVAPARLSADGTPSGLAPITRHPMNLGVALWAATHVVVNGWATDVMFFGAHVLLGVIGAWHQDARLPATRPAYAALVERTSFLPRPVSPTALGGRAWAGLGLGVLVAIGLRLAH